MTELVPPAYETLCRSRFAELERWLRRGSAPAVTSLAGWEFRGYNVLPLTELIRVRKFKKGFEALPGEPTRLTGYNVDVRQNGLHGPWLQKMRGGEPARQFPFVVRQVEAHGPDGHYPNALLLDYGLPGKLPLDPASRLRDYLVQLSPETPDLLLGKAYAALGPLRLPLSFFVLERYNRAL